MSASSAFDSTKMLGSPPCSHAALSKAIEKKQGFLIVGLDPDIKQIPEDFEKKETPATRIYHFCRLIVKATCEYVVGYKPNIAYFEAYGAAGYGALEQTIEFIRSHAPEALILLDAKRADVPHTAAHYAKAYFEHLDVDGLTLSPYMGKDSLMPYLHYEKKWLLMLAITSNNQERGIQCLRTKEGTQLWEESIRKSITWIKEEQTILSIDRLMFVVGATNDIPTLKLARQLAGDHFLLVPGIGTQGGDLKTVWRVLGKHTLVPVSRSILYAAKHANDLAKESTQAAQKHQQSMRTLMLP